jgi:D-lactate dehydrogenase
MLHPELTASASAVEALTVNQNTYDAYLSTNLTCEVAMSRATRKHYQHILTQLNELT